MNLKKNDKIIAVVGVIILIVAAIGIIVYTPSEEDETIEPTQEEKTLFDVVYEEKTSPSETITETFGGGLLLKSASTISIEEFFTVNKDNIKSIEFNISYQDNKVGGLLGLLFKNMVGNDKLDVTIIDPDGTEKAAERISGSGSVIVEFAGINKLIDTSQIEAESKSEADTVLQSRIDDSASKWMGESFSMTATHKVAETLRPLLRLRERLDKDSFDVTITYTYYDYDVEQVDTGEDGNENGDEINEENINTDYKWSGIKSMSGRDW
jgi:hypothetical protein